MAVQSITYSLQPGQDRIYDARLAFGVIYSVAKNGGNDYTQVEANPVGQQFTYTVETGALDFAGSDPWNEGDYITVIYKALGRSIEPPVPPETCDPVTIATLSVIGMGQLSASTPDVGMYTVDLLSGSGVCGNIPIRRVAIENGNSITFTSVPDGSYRVCITKNCGGGMTSTGVLSSAVTLTTPPINLGFRKVMSDPAIKLLSVTGTFYTVTNGSFPLVTASQQLNARHEGFSGVSFKAEISVKKKQQVVGGLYKNGALVQFLPAYRTTAGNVSLTFNPISALATDQVFINIDYT